MVDLYGSHPAIPANVDTQTGAPANAEIAIALSGRARFLSEYVMGELTTGSEPAAPVTAHANAPGHTHSGGADGQGIVRPYWSASYGYPDALLTTSTITNGRAPAATIRNGAPAAASGEKAYMFNGSVRNFWIPGGASDSLHNRGKLTAEIYTDTAITAYFSVRGDTSYSKALSVGFNDITVDNYVDLVPGTLNSLPLEIWTQGTAAANTITTLCSFALNQISSSP